MTVPLPHEKIRNPLHQLHYVRAVTTSLITYILNTKPPLTELVQKPLLVQFSTVDRDLVVISLLQCVRPVLCSFYFEVCIRNRTLITSMDLNRQSYSRKDPVIIIFFLLFFLFSSSSFFLFFFVKGIFESVNISVVHVLHSPLQCSKRVQACHSDNVLMLVRLYSVNILAVQFLFFMVI